MKNKMTDLNNHLFSQLEKLLDPDLSDDELKKEIARGGWPEAIAEIYAEEGGTPHLDRRHTVFGQLMDEASYQVLDTIAAVETGAMDKPKEDVVMESIDIEDEA